MNGYDLLAASLPDSGGTIMSGHNAGLYPAMERVHYDALGYFSQTVLKKWIALRSLPSEFRYWLDHRTEDDGKECLLIGDALDCCLLDGSHKFHERFMVAPKCDRRTKAGKELWDLFQAKAEGRIVVTEDQRILIRNMEAALLENEATKDVFKHCKKVNLIAELGGFPCKSEVDLWMDNGEHMMDLKTCRDVSPGAFRDAFYNFGYRYQATFYLMLAQALGLGKTVFDFVCVKNTAPFTVRVYSFSPETDDRHAIVFDAARKELFYAMGGLDVRLREDNFKDDQEWELIQVPDWAIRRAQNQEVFV